MNFTYENASKNEILISLLSEKEYSLDKILQMLKFSFVFFDGGSVSAQIDGLQMQTDLNSLSAPVVNKKQNY
jgi:hypothetical protein